MLRHLSTKATLEESRIKIIIVGDKNVGKTSFLIRYCSNPLSNERTNSLFNNFNAHLKYKDKIVKLDFWELPASEEYLKMRQINYPQTDAFFILYSIDDANSLQNALNLWYSEIKTNNSDNNPVVFIGNKTDIRNVNPQTIENDESRSLILSKKEAKEKITDKIGTGILFFECSSLMQNGINEICLETIKSVLDQREKNSFTKRDNCCALI